MSKAFDSLLPPLLLSKLRAYGFEESTMNLLRFYRTDRRNRVKLGPVKSNWHTVNRGCPQGSALGPPLWDIFENDLTYEIKSNVSMYTDDHQLYEMGKDLAKVKSSLAGNAEKASRWYEVNLLKGNFSKYKTTLMHNDDKVTTTKSEFEYSRKWDRAYGQAISLYYARQLTAIWTSATILRWRLIWMRSAILRIRVVSDIRQYRDACVDASLKRPRKKNAMFQPVV